MSFYERFYGFRALSIIGKCTSRHLFAYGGLQARGDTTYDPAKIKWTENYSKECPIPLMSSVVYDRVKTGLTESQAKRKYAEGLRASTVIGLFFRFRLRLRQSSFHWITSDRVISGIGRKMKIG